MFIRILATSRDEIGNKIQGRATTKSLTGRLGSGHDFLSNKTDNFRVTVFKLDDFLYSSFFVPIQKPWPPQDKE